MAFAMTSLKRLKSGAFSARKSIPKDVRGEYRALFGGGWEEQFYAEAGTELGDAKRALNEWLAAIEARIAAIRAGAGGEGQSLTHREALGLAGEWYLWFVGRHEDDPGDPEVWEDRLDEAQSELRDCAPEWFRKNEALDPDWKWVEAEDVRVLMRPFIADKAETSQFLASSGIALTAEARERFLDAVETEYAAALKLLLRRAEGDFKSDTRPERFPKFTQAPRASLSGPSCFELFEAWIQTNKPSRSTVDRWRAVFLDLQAHFSDRNAGSITQDEARAWKDRLITDNRSARTVSDIWLIAASLGPFSGGRSRSTYFRPIPSRGSGSQSPRNDACAKAMPSRLKRPKRSLKPPCRSPTQAVLLPLPADGCRGYAPTLALGPAKSPSYGLWT
jgi:hypothetical protein